MDLFPWAETRQVARTIVWSDPSLHLRAVLVLDNLTLGPAAGGIRTRRYTFESDVFEDAARLARAMTVKCALAGLNAGGGKLVLWEPAGPWPRAQVFARLGEEIEALGGLFRTAGDLGTTATDLEAVAARTRYVHKDEHGLANSVAHGLLRCLQAVAETRDKPVRGLRVAVQGLGAVGRRVMARLVAEGAQVWATDLDPARVAAATESGAQALDPAAFLSAPVDVLVPCADGGLLTEENVNYIHAWAICGAANNLLASPEAGVRLHQRKITLVPDALASAGAVIDGIGASVMGLSDRTPLLERLGDTTRKVLSISAEQNLPPEQVASRWAASLIAARIL